MKNTALALFALLFLTFNFGIAQEQETETEQLSLNEGTLDSQFEYILKKSGNFRGTNGSMYEAVKQSDILKVRANVADSLKKSYSRIDELEANVSNQAEEITTLKSNLGSTQSTLDETNLEKDSMSLFGLQMSKTSYNILMWSIAGGLLALLLFFMYKFKNSNSSTQDAKRKLAEVEHEFDEHRRVALEREQKVRRQLQDELNKQKS
ncbi:tRNA (guanine-N1)-methyltransferase [Winogradskyella maritima]|uniref:tRNA (Guanine-N1)-methyltransferase n=1 Tax=Winogradskyella maritima TaxID=1517766 RepID=A0ABV8ACG4_9FLAO